MKPFVFTLLGCLFSTLVESSVIVYNETFPGYRDPNRYIRIAKACEAWEIVRDESPAFLNVNVFATRRETEGLIVWDLAPIRFHRIQFKVKHPEGISERMPPTLALSDRFGRSYIVSLDCQPIGDEGWQQCSADIEKNVVKVFDKGQEVSPYVHALGSETTQFDGFDFDNVAFNKVYIHVKGIENQSVRYGVQSLKLLVDKHKKY